MSSDEMIFESIIYVVFGLLFGVIIREIKIKLKASIPFIGIVIEKLGIWYSTIKSDETINQHLLLHDFLPALILSRALSIRFYPFWREFGKALILAIPEVIVIVSLISVIYKLVLPYNWSFLEGLYFSLSRCLTTIKRRYFEQLCKSVKMGTSGFNYTIPVLENNEVLSWEDGNLGQFGQSIQPKSISKPKLVLYLNSSNFKKEILTQNRCTKYSKNNIIDVYCGYFCCSIIVSIYDEIVEPKLYYTLIIYSEKTFTRLHNQYKETNGREKTKLLTYIRVIFSLPTILIVSFIPRKKNSESSKSFHISKNKGPIGQKYYTFKLDKYNLYEKTEQFLENFTVEKYSKSLDNFYTRIYKTKDKDFLRSLNTSLKTSIFTISRFIISTNHYKDLNSASLRILLITRLNPIYLNGGNRILIDFYKILSIISTKICNEFITWCIYYSPEIFYRRLLRPLVFCIDKNMAKYSKDDNNEKLYDILGKLYQTFSSPTNDKNNSTTLRKTVSPKENFYVNNISLHFNLLINLLKWQSLLKCNINVNVPDNPPFFICSHAFLLNHHTKIILLKIQYSTESSIALRIAQRKNKNSFPIMKKDRNKIVESDTFQLSKEELKRPVRIILTDEHGTDLGSVTNEFFHLFMREFMDPKYEYFEYSFKYKTLWFSNKSTSQSKLTLYYCCGIVIGLAVFNGISIELIFPSVINKNFLGWKSNLNDLKNLDPEIGRSLETILKYKSDNFEDLFCITLEVNNLEKDSLRNTYNLIHNRDYIPVININQKLFVTKYIKYILHSSVKNQSNAFTHGIRSICGVYVLKLFGYQEFELSICVISNLDFENLKNKARYINFDKNHSVIKLFWEIVLSELNKKQTKQLLFFDTGFPRAPITGLADLYFVIQRIVPDYENIPKSKTCFSVLLISDYITNDSLRKKLLISLRIGQGRFGYNNYLYYLNYYMSI